MQEGLAGIWDGGMGDGNEELWTASAGMLVPSILCMVQCDAAEGNSVRDGVGVFLFGFGCCLSGGFFGCCCVFCCCWLF